MGRRRIIVEDGAEGTSDKEVGEQKAPEPETTEKSSKSQLDSAQEGLRAFLQAFGTDAASCIVYRFLPTGQQAYCGMYPPEAISEEFLSETFGAGKYWVRLRNEKGEWMKNKTVHIFSRLDLQEPRPYGGKPQTAPAPDRSIEVLELIRSEMALQREMMTRIVDKLATGGNDRSTFTEVASAMQTLKTVVHPDKDSGLNPTALINSFAQVLAQGIDIGRKGAAGPSTGESIMTTIRDVAQSAGQILTELRRPKEPAPANPSVAMPANSPENAPAQSLISGLDPSVVSLLRQGISYLKGKAIAGKDPGLWVDFIVDNLDEDYWQAVCAIAEKPIEELAALDPEIVNLPFRPWFEAVFKGVRHAISERISPPGESGDEGHAPGNGEVDAGSGE